MRTQVVAVVLAAALIGALAGCSLGPKYSGVCEDTATQLRTDDGHCQQQGQGSGSAQFIWVYYLVGRAIPPVGNFVYNATVSPPTGADLANGGVPTDGTDAAVGGSGGGSGGGDEVVPHGNQDPEEEGNEGGSDKGGGGSGGGDEGGEGFSFHGGGE